MRRQRTVVLYSAVGAALTAGCLVFANLLSSQFHLRADLSADGLYSLSPGSERILRELPGPVEARVFFSRKLPPEYEAARSYVADLLAEYRDASDGKVNTSFLDVDSDKGRREALEQGIAPVEFNVISHEKFEIRQGFMGIVLQHGDRKEVLPVVARIDGLEYDLTSRMLRLTRAERKVVGVLSSHGALGPESLEPRVREFMERSYEIRPLDLRGLTPGATIPADVSGLLILGPQEELPDYHLYTLDQFLLSGRPLVLGVDTRKTDFRSFMVSGLKTRLPEYLRRHGIRLRQNFVLDEQSQKVQISQKSGWFTITNLLDFPLFVVATDLDENHPVTRHLDALTLPMVSPVEVSTAVDSSRVRVLARSSSHSWLHVPWERGVVHSINPMSGFKRDPDDEPGPFPLAVEVDGPFDSFFSLGAEAAHPLPAEAAAGTFLESSRPGSRLLVVGTSRFARPEMPSSDTGAVFLLNLIDWIAQDSDLIAIRSKGAVYRPLRELGSPVKKAAVRWTNIIGPAVLVAVFGLARMQRRRSLRRRRAKAYRAAADA